MLSVDIVKTVLAHKNRRIYILFITPVVLVLFLFGIWLNNYKPSDNLLLGSHKYSLIIAKTPASQEKGLGDRNSLPQNQGMLFAYQGQALYCFWMKDMRFSLDMIWVNSDKKVVYIKQDVSPNSYPKAFCSPNLAEYVIELNAGQVQAAGIYTGEHLNF
jgi:uncharacterized membrane protein (UPF0127 family)